MPDQRQATAAMDVRFGLAPSASFARRVEPVLVGAGGFVLATAVASADGGYYSDSWAWLALASLAIATVRLIFAPVLGWRPLDWAFAGSLAGFSSWVAASALWAPATTPVVDETLRAAAYTAVALALLLVVSARTVEPLLAGVLLGVTAVSSYALLTRLQPERFEGWDPDALFRLAGPIGYWNGLGAYAAMGTLLAVGLAARSHRRFVQGLAGAAPVALLPTILFTFSRGAWLALAVGLVAAFVFDPRRLQLAATVVVLAPWPALALLAATRSDHLTRSTITVEQATEEGGRLLVWIGALALAGAAAAIAVRLVEPRIRVGDRAHRMLAGGALAAIAVAAVAFFAAVGSPWQLAERAVDAFEAPPKGIEGDATDRLFDLSSNGRIEQWRVSVEQIREDPLLGQGAGSYLAAWDLNRPYPGAVQDAHSLYLEVLGELGVVGLVLLLVALAIPVVAGVRARRRPAATAAFAAYVAYLAHAGVDWDWELGGVTMVFLCAGAALVACARDGRSGLSRRARVSLATVTAALSLVAVFAVMTTMPLAAARDAYYRADFSEAAAEAQRAVDWAPWSSDAVDLRGRAELALGKTAQARASFEEATSRSPNDWELWRDLAAASPPAQARRAVRRALQLNPLEPELRDLAKSLSSSGGM